MSKLIFAFIFLFLNSAMAELPGLYKVSSTFTDQITGLPYRVTGTGVLLYYDDPKANPPQRRYFISTVGHVSQGKDLKILINGVPAKILNDGLARLANNTYDVEWIEIEDPHVKNLIAYIQTCREYNINDDYLRARDNHEVSPGTSIGFCLFIVPEVTALWNDGGPAATLANILRSGRNILSASPMDIDVILLPSWTDRASCPDDRLTAYNLDHLFSVSDQGINNQVLEMAEGSFGGEYRASLKVKPGMSGAPLIRDSRYIDGLVKSYDRQFDSSSFVSKRTLVGVLKHYLDGKRGLDDDTVLEHRHGLTYRKYKNGLVGVNLIRGLSGGGERGDGGAGGTGEMNICSSKDFYSKLGAMPGLSYISADDKTISSVIAMRSPFASHAVIFANEAAAEATLKYGIDKFEMISLGSPLVPLLYEKLWSSGGSEKFPVGKEVTWPAKGTHERAESAELNFNAEQAELKIYFGRNLKLDLHFKKDGTCLEGGYDHFVPIVLVNGYWVDLRRLFFTDLSAIGWGGLQNINPPRIKFRKSGDPYESELVFY